MRKLLLILLMLVVGNGYAQEAKDGYESSLENVGNLTGEVILKEYNIVGEIQGLNSKVKVSYICFTNMSTSNKTSGIKIEVSTSGTFPQSNYSFVDYDEIDSLVKGLLYLDKIDVNISKFNSFEAMYNTKDGLSIIVFNADGKLKMAVKAGEIGSVTSYTNISSLGILIRYLESAKKSLDYALGFRVSEPDSTSGGTP